MSDSLAESWKHILEGKRKPWVLFSHGTCVVLQEPGDDLAGQAEALLREHGPVHVGTDTADFNVVRPEGQPGWIVTCHHPDILVYVGPEGVPPETDDLLIGLLGRSSRKQDAESPVVVHVEHSREGE